MQPLRSKALERGISLPLVDLRAPKDKISFIKSLQPFYMSGNIIHAKHLPDLESELLQFPTGRMDVPNALAYFLRMRAGRVVYEDFTSEHIAPFLDSSFSSPRWLLVSSRPALTAALLIQYVNGVLRVYQDWVQDRPPIEALPHIIREAIMVGGGEVRLAAPQEQFDKYTNHGIVAAAKRDNVQLTRVGWASKSEGSLKPWLSKRERGEPALLVADEARWCINAFMRGYARKIERDGSLMDKPIDNGYCVLMEAFESFIAWFEAATKMNDMNDQVRYARTSDGRRYISAMPGAQ